MDSSMIDLGRARSIVERATGEPIATVDSADVQSLGYWTGSVHRVLFRATTQAGQPIELTTILKTERPRPRELPTSHLVYPKREALAYDTGFMNQLPDSMAVARCYGTEERPDGAHWLWLEEIKDPSGAGFSLERLALAARHIGELGGRFLAGDRPAHEWLCSGVLRQYCNSAGSTLEQLRSGLMEHPLVKQVCPPQTLERIIRLKENEGALLAVLDRLPQTLAHFDYHHRNLFDRTSADGQVKTVVIDWQFLGTGAVGEDLAQLVPVSVFFGDVAADQADRLEELSFHAYLAGLAAKGWEPNPAEIRLARDIHVGLRWTLSTLREATAVLATMDQQQIEAIFQRPQAELLAAIHWTLHYGVKHGERALAEIS